MKRNTSIVKVENESPAIIQSLDFPELIERFLDSQDVRPISKEVYRKGLERFLSWIVENDIIRPDRQTILDFKTYLQESGLSANTVNSYLIGVRQFFAFLESERLYPNVAKTIKGIRQPKGNLREVPTLEQALDLLNKIDVSTVIGKRDFAMINLMLRTGLRTIEVIRASVEDLRQAGTEAILWIQGKGRDSKDEPSVLTDKALSPILNYLKARGVVQEGSPLFVSHSDRNKGGRLTTRTIRDVTKRYLKEIGIERKGFSAHSFRHFFVSELVKAGAPPLQIQAAARHASFDTTQRYIHSIGRIENAAERYITF